MPSYYLKLAPYFFISIIWYNDKYELIWKGVVLENESFYVYISVPQAKRATYLKKKNCFY